MLPDKSFRNTGHSKPHPARYIRRNQSSVELVTIVSNANDLVRYGAYTLRQQEMILVDQLN